MDKDTKKLLAEAQRQGFVVRYNRKGHAEVCDQDGRKITTFAGSASDYRSWRNSLAPLRRAGFVWPPRR